MKFGSASVPIYQSDSKGRKRFIIAHYRDGKRIRKAFPDLAAAKKEALFVAQRIQSGMQHVTDQKPHERDNYKKAVELLDSLGVPLVAAVEDYVQARKLVAAILGVDEHRVRHLAAEHRHQRADRAGNRQSPAGTAENGQGVAEKAREGDGGTESEECEVT